MSRSHSIAEYEQLAVARGVSLEELVRQAFGEGASEYHLELFFHNTLDSIRKGNSPTILEDFYMKHQSDLEKIHH